MKIYTENRFAPVYNFLQVSVLLYVIFQDG